MIDPANGCKIYIRATQCSASILGDEKAVNGFLEDVTELIGMRAMEPPTTFRVGDGEPYHSEVDAGISGSVVWMESGGLLHSWPELGQLHFDCESCKEFNVGALVDFTRATFKALEVRTYDLSYVMGGGVRSPADERLRAASVAAYNTLQRLSPGTPEAVELGRELFL